MRNVLLFLRLVRKHWGSLVTGGFLIGVLSIYQGTGHSVAHWVYWTIAVAAFLLSAYRVWLTEYERVGRAELETKNRAIRSTKLPNIRGFFHDVKVVRHGLITDESDTGQQWMACGVAINVSLTTSGRGTVCITGIRLQTYKDKPYLRDLPPIVPFITVKLGEENGTVSFQAFPQIEYLYEGTRNLPQSIEAVLSDEFGREHLIHLREGETLPDLPFEYSIPRVTIMKETIDNSGQAAIVLKNIGNATAQSVGAKQWFEAGKTAIYISDPNIVMFMPQIDTKNRPHTDGTTRTLEPGAEYVFSWLEVSAEKSQVQGQYPDSRIRTCGEISYTSRTGALSFVAKFGYQTEIGPHGWVLRRCPGLGTAAYF